MDLTAKLNPNLLAFDIDSRQAAQVLGNLLKQTAEYQAFFDALKAVNADQQVQKLGAEMNKHRSALQWGRDDDRQHAVELARLEEEIESLPSVQVYRRAEQIIVELFTTVDQVISAEAGVAFAANAKRGGCCG